ncbi:DUF1573 domain-containing protein [Tenacibaculum sp. UWU-22]|uniref:DUF1573 domain-containing protein n=1 Tax=Tenacibaculum sp. UWU-22 TaxID=3234187 RepID=UPI0034DB2A89
MKKVIVAFAFVVFAVTLNSCKKGSATSKVKSENVVNAEKRDNDISKGSPVVSFDKTEYNFGTVKEGDIVTTSFKVTNTGKSDLVITRATATCGCTIPTWPREPIAPGESGELKVRFNTRGKKNRQSKTVTLYTNTASGREYVKLSGMVTPTPIKKTNS